jgi:hypothetical protein
LAALAALAATPLRAQHDDPEPQPKTRKPNLIERMMAKGFLVIPVAFYAPETRFGAGIGGYYYFRPNPSDSLSRPSSINLAAVYTQNRQATFQLPMQLAFDEDRLLLNLDLAISRYPFRFYGVGNGISLRESEGYTPDIARIKAVAMRKLAPHFFAGPLLRFEYQRMRKVEPGGLLDAEAVPGAKGGRAFGLGAQWMLDHRNNIFTPTKGYYWSGAVYRMSEAWGSQFQGTSFSLDARAYLPLGKASALAFQAYWEGWSGTPPFFLMARMGGYYRMRGYFDGAYRDKHYRQAQAEWRAKVWGPLGVAVFASAGQVGPTASLKDAHWRYAGGAGLRILFNKKENIYLRIDHARGKGTSGTYITVAEAF